ncbi:MAG: GatB/YqeY domain-containing protein [Patescibacteria group bacterium]
MAIKEKIEKDLIDAARAKDKTRLATLRLLKSSLENKRIELMKQLTDDEAIAVLKTEAKKRKEAIESFTAGGREEMAEAEKQELAIIESYLPAQMSAEALEEKVKALVEKIPADQRDFGKIMGLVMKELKGQADGQAVNQTLKKILG